MNLLKKVALSSSIVLACSFAVAQPGPKTPEQKAQGATELRQSIFKLMGSNMGPLGAMARGRMDLDTAVVEKNATRIHQLSLMIEDYFKHDTREFDVTTEALDAVWEKPEAFSKAIATLTEKSAALAAAAATGDAGATKGAIAGVGRSCGGCHDDFKAE